MASLTSPADALAATHNWAEWAGQRRAWWEVVQAHSLGEWAAQLLFRGQLLRAENVHLSRLAASREDLARRCRITDRVAQLDGGLAEHTSPLAGRE